MEIHEFRRICCGNCGNVVRIPVPCGDRFCEVCGYSRRKRVSIRMDYLLRFARSQCPDRIRFVTLTLLPSPDPAEGFRLLISAFRRLRNSALWRSRVKGGFYVVEATKSAEGWHVHLHALVQGFFLPQRALSRTWKAITGAPVVDVRRAPSSAPLTAYLTKYLRKCSVEGDQRRELSAALRSCRLFQPFGSFSNVFYEPPRSPFPCPHCKCDDWILLDKRTYVEPVRLYTPSIHPDSAYARPPCPA